MPATVKEQAHRLIDALPEEATWEDLMYGLYVRQAVEQGLEDSEAGRVIPVDEVRARLGLPRSSSPGGAA